MSSDVTVIVVGYNHAQYIETCLDSIAAQTEPPARVLVMDDASPDQTAEVAREWASRTCYPIEIRRNSRNQGLCATLNEALHGVSTDFYAYISADDHVEADRLRLQANTLRDAPGSVAGVYSDAFIEDEHGARQETLASEHFSWPVPLPRPVDMYAAVLRQNWIPAPSVLLRTETVRAVGGYDPQLYFEDLDLWLRLLSAEQELRCIPEPLVTFRVLASSLGHTTFEENNLRFLAAMRRILHKQLSSGRAGDDLEIRRRLWWLAVRSARLGKFDDGVFADLVRLRRQADVPRPTRATVGAALRGLITAAARRSPSLGDDRLHGQERKGSDS